ncbi:MAG: hypothetical protein IPK19_13195 [Chloroflexi bacterium]|nr:hypothetical protein [Chloroflexota bacterium]
MKIKTLLLILLLDDYRASCRWRRTPPAEEEIPSAQILNEQGGPASITGEVNTPTASSRWAWPSRWSSWRKIRPASSTAIAASDRAESQVLGKITSDFYTSPFTYRIDQPIEPAGTLRDVDQDGEADTGVMVYPPSPYWTNTWGDPYLEERDLYGGGWSSAYASTRVDPNPSAKGEIIGGKY